MSFNTRENKIYMRNVEIRHAIYTIYIRLKSVVDCKKKKTERPKKN